MLIYCLAVLIHLNCIETLIWPVAGIESGRELAWEARRANESSELPPIALEPVSVVICARNEANNLEAFLPAILQQNYIDAAGQRAFEVIVVNDASTDNSATVLQLFEQGYEHLTVVHIAEDTPRQFPGKKFALSRGVEAARHNIILMTDADCKPSSPDWIRWMAFPFSNGIEIVAGHGDFVAGHGFLNKFIRAETLHTYALYSRACQMGMPYMAVGRNLAVRKHLVLAAQQHLLWTKSASGDDDMLIRICATKDNMVVNAHPHSFTYSIPKATFREYLRQKQRHVSTGKLYSAKVKAWLGMHAFSHALFWTSFLVLLGYMLVADSNLVAVTVVLGLFLLRGLYFYSGLQRWSRVTGGQKLDAFWPLFDICWMLYNIILSPYILWKTKKAWK